MEGVGGVARGPFKQEEGTSVVKIPPHVPSSIPIIAPVSDEVDKHSLTSEEEEVEFATPVGTPKGQTTVGKRNGLGRPAEGGISAEEEEEEEEDEEEEGFSAVAKVRKGSNSDSDSDSDSDSSSSSSKSFSASTSGFPRVRLVAKLSGDDDEHFPDEGFVSEVEDQNEGFGVARIAEFAVPGGLRVAGDLGFDDGVELGLREESSLERAFSEGVKGSSVLVGEPKGSGFGEFEGLGSVSNRESEVGEGSVKGPYLKGFGDMDEGDVHKSGGVVEGEEIGDFVIRKDVEGMDKNGNKSDGGLGMESVGEEKKVGGREETETEGIDDVNTSVNAEPSVSGDFIGVDQAAELESAEQSESDGLRLHSEKAAEEWITEVVGGYLKGEDVEPSVNGTPKTAVAEVEDPKEGGMDDSESYKEKLGEASVGADAVDNVGDIKEVSLVDHSSKDDSTQVSEGNEIDPRKESIQMEDTLKAGDAINAHLPTDLEFNLPVSTGEEPEDAQAMKTEAVQQTNTVYSSVGESKQEVELSQIDMQESSEPKEHSEPEKPAANADVVGEVHVDSSEAEASPSEDTQMPNAEASSGNHSFQKVVDDDNSDEDEETLGMLTEVTSGAVVDSVISCPVEENTQKSNANEINDSQEKANEVVLPNAFTAQQSIDKEDTVETKNVINESSLLDSESKQRVATSENQDDTQGREAADEHQTKASENQAVKGLYFVDAATMEEAKLGLEPQNSQSLEVSKENVEFFQGKLSRSLESKEFIESKVPIISADAGLEWKDDIAKLESPPYELDTSNAGGVYESKTYVSTEKQDNKLEVSDEEETVMPYANRQFKFESDSGDDSVQKAVGQMMTDWDEGDDDEDEEEEEMVDPSALAALMEAASSAVTGSNNASFGAAGFPVSTRPAGLGSSVPSLDPMPRFLHHTRANAPALSRPSPTGEDNQQNGDLHDVYDETQEKLQKIRVKFLRLVQRLGQTPQNVVVTQVLYRLGLAEGLKRGTGANRAFNPDRASTIAQELEAKNQEDLDFTCNILVLGKTGVGKSATINSIFDGPKCATNAFQPATNKVQEILGSVHGIKVRIVDTPGLMPSSAGQRRNKNIMLSAKKFVKKCPPDIVLYFDRLDVQSRDFSDLPLLKLVTETFGAAIWFNTIVVFTHASSAPPDGANGTPLSYEMLVAQRSHIVQHSIRQAAGDMRLMNPVSLVENHSACRRNRDGQRVLPNGQVWKPQLLLLCFASKVLAEANALLKLQDTTPGRSFGLRNRAPPLPFLLSSLLQSRPQLKAPDDQNGEDIESDEDLEEESSDSEDEDEYDQLPPFKYLTKDELSKLTKEQKKAYHDEIDYREKLYQKKQWKEELRRRRQMKKKKKAQKANAARNKGNFSYEEENPYADAENPYNETEPVVMPDMALPPSFDAETPIHRYRYWDSANQWLVRPVLDTHGWDHDVGYDGVNLEKMLVLGGKIPASVSGQVTKDKKEANLQMECAASLKHGEHATTTAGFDVQTVGKGLAYTLRSESRFSNYKRNKTAGGLSLSYIGNTLAAGMKLEDVLLIGKRLKLVVNGGAMMGRGDVACGGSLEATVRDKDYPIGQTLTTLGISIMNWHGDLAIGGNLQSQFVVGRKMTMVTRANLNNRGSGQISIRTSSSEQLQIALIGLIPVFRSLISGRLFGPPDSPQ